jgi:predicted Rossmann fold nucleotide-binding protein DprA/Smf involved in DNA uptake
VSSLQQRILSELGYNKLSEDELCERLNINYSELARELTTLEISDIIGIENGNIFVK